MKQSGYPAQVDFNNSNRYQVVSISDRRSGCIEVNPQFPIKAREFRLSKSCLPGSPWLKYESTHFHREGSLEIECNLHSRHSRVAGSRGGGPKITWMKNQ